MPACRRIEYRGPILRVDPVEIRLLVPQTRLVQFLFEVPLPKIKRSTRRKDHSATVIVRKSTVIVVEVTIRELVGVFQFIKSPLPHGRIELTHSRHSERRVDIFKDAGNPFSDDNIPIQDEHSVIHTKKGFEVIKPIEGRMNLAYGRSKKNEIRLNRRRVPLLRIYAKILILASGGGIYIKAQYGGLHIASLFLTKDAHSHPDNFRNSRYHFDNETTRQA